MIDDDLELVDLRGRPAGDRADRASRDRAAHRTGRRPTGRMVWAGALVLVLTVLAAWTVIAYLHLREVRTDLLSVREDLDVAAEAVRAGDLARAGDLLRDLEGELSAVPDRVRSWRAAPARALPRLGATLDAVADLSRGAALAAGAGLLVTDALGVDGDGLGALTPVDGTVPLDIFADIAPALADAEAMLVEAEALVTGIPDRGIEATAVDARSALADVLTSTVTQVGAARTVVDIVPAMLGAEGERRYMVVASNPTEPRGSGGFFGAYTIMTARDGQLSFSTVRPTQDLPELPRGQIPWPDESLEARYDVYGGTGFIVNLNMTPDFPSAATAIENFYREATGEPLDGLIAVNPFAFESLLEIAGAVELPGYGQVQPDEVVEFVSHDAYAVITDPEERKALIGLVATTSLQAVLASPDTTSPGQVVRALGDMFLQESILVHAADADVQAALEELGSAGRLGDGGEGDYLGVFLNSGASYKIDYWLQRRVQYDVELGPDGVAAATVLTGFTNTAPTSGEPDYMIGKGEPPLDVGDVLSMISVYCAPGCTIHEAPDSGFADLETERGVELGFGVASVWSELPAGRASTFAWSYTTPDAWTQRGTDRVYRLRYGHQVSIIPPDLEIRIAVPPGFVASSIPEGATADDDRVTLSLAAVHDLDLEVVFSPADRQADGGP